MFNKNLRLPIMTLKVHMQFNNMWIYPICNKLDCKQRLKHRRALQMKRTKQNLSMEEFYEGLWFERKQNRIGKLQDFYPSELDENLRKIARFLYTILVCSQNIKG